MKTAGHEKHCFRVLIPYCNYLRSAGGVQLSNFKEQRINEFKHYLAQVFCFHSGYNVATEST